jgi:hypothetical protein
MVDKFRNFSQVIDDQKKTEELERAKTGKGTSRPSQDIARYPEGVKKFTIDHGAVRTQDRKYFTSGYGELSLCLINDRILLSFGQAQLTQYRY